jgi:hypothetical protein
MLFYIYLIFLELSPVVAFIYSWLTWHQNINYLWAELCLKFAGCKVTFLKKSHHIAFYEMNGCLFLSNREDNEDEDLYTTVIDTYITNGWALALTPYSYLTTCWNKKNYLSTSLANSGYNNVIVYPIIVKDGRPSLYISLAWEKQISIQIILTHNKEIVLDIKKREATYGIQLYCYRSEVIRPKYFNTFDEFAQYVEIIWLDAHDLLENTLANTLETTLSNTE